MDMDINSKIYKCLYALFHHIHRYFDNRDVRKKHKHVGLISPRLLTLGMGRIHWSDQLCALTSLLSLLWESRSQVPEVLCRRGENRGNYCGDFTLTHLNKSTKKLFYSFPIKRFKNSGIFIYKFHPPVYCRNYWMRRGGWK